MKIKMTRVRVKLLLKHLPRYVYPHPAMSVPAANKLSRSEPTCTYARGVLKSNTRERQHLHDLQMLHDSNLHQLDSICAILLALLPVPPLLLSRVPSLSFSCSFVTSLPVLVVPVPVLALLHYSILMSALEVVANCKSLLISGKGTPKMLANAGVHVHCKFREAVTGLQPNMVLQRHFPRVAGLIEIYVLKDGHHVAAP